MKTDTPEVKKQFTELLATLKEIAMQKRALLNFVKDDGFHLNEYLHQRAVVLMGKDAAKAPKTSKTERKQAKDKQQTATPARTTATNVSEEPKTPAASTTASATELKVLHPEVLDALTIWRRQRALTAHMPAYCILQQKAIIAIANLLPEDKDALARIPFCGKVKAEKYGDEILAVVKETIGKE